MLESERSGLAALLAWYRDMGVDTAVGETPVDWLGRGDVAPGASPMIISRAFGAPR